MHEAHRWLSVGTVSSLAHTRKTTSALQFNLTVSSARDLPISGNTKHGSEIVSRVPQALCRSIHYRDNHNANGKRRTNRVSPSVLPFRIQLELSSPKNIRNPTHGDVLRPIQGAVILPLRSVNDASREKARLLCRKQVI